MRIIFLIGVNLVLCFLSTIKLQAQTSIAGGDWNETAIWSTGTVPTPISTVNANHPLALNTSITITSGTYNMSNYITDLSGGAAYNLTMTGGTLEIKSDTTAFGGTATFSNATVIVRSGAALFLGPTTLDDGVNFLVEAGAYLIVNGNFRNERNSNTLIVNGIVDVDGNYTTHNGTVHITGTGNIKTTGSIESQGNSMVFGSRNECSLGPCSGQSLCSFNNVLLSNQAICPGSAATALTSSLSPGSGAEYVWQSSTTSEVSGFTDTGITSENYPAGLVNQTTWYRRQVTRNGCIGMSIPVKITVLPTNGWKGTTSANWNTASNWCSNSVPTSITDVVIPRTGSGVPNSPEISSSAECRNITVNSLAQVTVNGTSSFSIYGTLNNNGTLATNSSIITFAGATTQTIKGLPTNFYNLTINNSSPNTVVVETYVAVTNQLNLLQGNVNLSGYNFTLGINTGSPGSLTRTAGTFYNGNLTRWISNTTLTIGDNRGLFPVGTASNYRPMYIGHGGITSGGTMRVSHTDAPTISNVSVNDAGTTIILRHDSNWRVTSADGLSGSSLQLLAEGTGYGIIDDLNHLRLMLANSVIGSHVPNPSTPTPPISNAQVTRSGLSSADLNNTFYLGSINSLTPLPLILLSFTGSWSTDGVLLEWKTNFEENFDYFVLERSIDGVLFRPIGRIDGTGEKNIIVNHYEYLDTEAHGGRYYYRLNQVDIDKSFEYSKVITVITGDRGESFTIFPNPVVDNKFTVKISSELSHAQLILYDQYGKTYVTADLVQGEQEIFIGNTLSNGVYFAKVLGLSTPKIIKLVINN